LGTGWNALALGPGPGGGLHYSETSLRPDGRWNGGVGVGGGGWGGCCVVGGGVGGWGGEGGVCLVARWVVG